MTDKLAEEDTQDVIIERLTLVDGTIVDVLDGTRFGTPTTSGEDY